MSYSYEEDQRAQAEYELRQEELRHQDRLAEQQQEPDVVPCFRCNAAMYQESPYPEENVCSECQKIPSTTAA